ncbi:MAG: efflux RND transporter periplasmic adaptor subunit, partial [Alphaproteobacteria bacterium]
AEEAQKDEDVATADLAVALSDVEVAKASLEDAKAQLKYDEVLLDHHILRAPYRAIIVERRKELGTILTAGEPLFTLADPKTIWILGYVDESRAGDIRLQQQAEVHLRSLPRKIFPGRVVRIGIESDRVNEERRVYIACDHCPETVYLGEQAEVFITTAVIKNALLVPATAVPDFDGTRGTVWTVENRTLHRRTVRFGYRTLDARLEIVGGLPSGAQVLTVLRPGLREGRRAKVLEQKAMP